MAETIAQEQAKTKPKLENFITEHLDAESRQEVLAFLDYCKAKKISYPWSSTNTWTLKAKGKSIGLIWLGGEKALDKYDDDTRWAIGVSFVELLQYDNFIIKESLQSILFNSLKHCNNCNAYCTSGYTENILGKEVRHLCRSLFILDEKTCINFKNPNATAIEQAKRVIDFKLAIPHGTANRVIFDLAAHGLTRIDNASQVCEVTDLQGNPIQNQITAISKVENLFDGQYNRYARFWTNENSYDVVFQLNKPATLVMYSLVTSIQLQVPYHWRLYGATSKSEPWTLLDEQGAFSKPVTSYTEKAFSISNPKTLQYYRLSFERCKFDLAQVHLYTQ